jgi:hypothetical protein
MSISKDVVEERRSELKGAIEIIDKHVKQKRASIEAQKEVLHSTEQSVQRYLEEKELILKEISFLESMLNENSEGK